MTLHFLAADPTAAGAGAWLPFIRDVGIPVAMAAAILWWALTRLERRLDRVEGAFVENTKATNACATEVKELRSSVKELGSQMTELRDVSGPRRRDR